MNIPWPNGKKAAVSLTYDDGLASHLDAAIPDLEAQSFRGTFYLWIRNGMVEPSAARWREAWNRGHEISNHSMRHPCRDGTPNDLLLRYTEKDLDDDVGGAEWWLHQNIGPDDWRTYAYPCGETRVGPHPGNERTYLCVVRENCFAARRVGGDPMTRVAAAADPWRINAFMGEANPEAYIDYCKQALAIGGWAVLVFHGIGGDWIVTPRAAHQRILKYLKESDADFWVAPFRDVARHVRTI